MNEKVAPELIHLDTATQRFGKRKIELLLEMWRSGDTLMDAVIHEMDLYGSKVNDKLQDGIRHGLAQIEADHPLPAVWNLLEKVEALPDWVDMERLKKGSEAYLSVGNVWIILALGPGSLVHTYSSPSIAHILMQTGNLVHMAQRRLIETGLWEIATILPGGLARGADGYMQNLQVRLLHARIRHTLLKHDWDVATQGMPLNQIEMARTWLDFTYVPFNALQKLGITFTNTEIEDLYHFWRYVAYLLGVDERLYGEVTSQKQARELLELIDGTTPEANEDSQILTQAMLDALVGLLEPSLKRLTPAHRYDLACAIIRRLHGHLLADQLRVKKTWMSTIMPLLACFNRLQRAYVRRYPPMWQAAMNQTIKLFQESANIYGKTTYQLYAENSQHVHQQFPKTVDPYFRNEI